MASSQDWAIPKGSTVLVTGANGFLASHIVDQFFQYGFRVRGAVRDVNRHAWMVTLFDTKYGKGRLELWSVPDLAAEGALDAAVEGVSAVVHTASFVNLDYDPNRVITPAIAFTLNALKAAYATPSVKRFVFCSSSSASVFTDPDRPGVVVTEETWNEEAVTKAWADPPYTPERAGPVYAASKVLTEQAVWNYYQEHRRERPDIVVNTVLPNMAFGTCLDPVNQGFPSTAGRILALYRGEIQDFHRFVTRQHFVDVQDVGRLHVVATIFDKVQSQRIFAFAERFNWDAVLDILRKIDPDRSFPENFSNDLDPNEIEPRHKAEQLLRDLGRPGWTPFEESIRNLVDGIHGADSKKAAGVS